MIRKLLSSLYFAEIKCGSPGESLPAKWLELLLLNSQSKGRRNNQKCGLEETVLLPKKVLPTHHHTRKLLQSSKKINPGVLQWYKLCQHEEYVNTGDKCRFGPGPKQAYFSEPYCDQTSGHTNNQWVPNERFGQYLSIETPWFTVLQIVWLLQLVKLEHFSKNQKSAENSQFLTRLKS